MILTRRLLLRSALFGSGLLGLRSLATGLPKDFLSSGIAHAATPTTPQFLILAAMSSGDPLNANCPGAYVAGAQNNPHPELAPESIALGERSYRAAKCWGTLPPALRSRLSFFHHQTNTNAHSEHRKVLALQGAAKQPSGVGEEILPSLIASESATLLGTLQAEPVPLGRTPLTYAGAALDNIAPVQLKALFGGTDAVLGSLTALRDRELDAIYAKLRAGGTRIQRQFLDRFALGRDQVRKLGEDLAELLVRLPTSAENNSPFDQVLAALALFKLKVAPVVSIDLPFGGDNHGDKELTDERDETLAGVGVLAQLWDELVAQGMQDQVTFASLNVFGRELVRNAGGGRNHNGSHHALLMFGKNVRPGVIGAIERVEGGHVAQAIDSTTGAGSPTGDIAPLDSLASAARTLWAAVDLDPARASMRIARGKVVTAALAK
jgi:hypothetical protein